ncbi:MAG: tetratricopeptide repeat protein [Janthinobacterium lividum]
MHDQASSAANLPVPGQAKRSTGNSEEAAPGLRAHERTRSEAQGSPNDGAQTDGVRSGALHDIGSAGAVAPVLRPEEIRMLAEIGFMGCGAGHTGAARLLFEGLRNLRPQRAFAYIGMAMSRLEAGDHDEAVRILREEGLRNNPGDDELLVYLGLALRLANRSAESTRVLRQVLDQNTAQTPELRLARRLLGEPAARTGEDDGT